MSWSLSTPSSSLPDVSGSRLLSESLPSPEPFDSHSHTGPGGADLSLSELSISDKDTERFHFHDRPRFSLLAPPATASFSFSPDQSRIAEDDEECEEVLDEEREEAKNEECEEGKDEGSDNGADITAVATIAAAKSSRKDKLESDLFILKKLNASFALFNDALRCTQTATQVCISFSSTKRANSHRVSHPTVQQVANQLAQTDALLNKYVNMLGKSEAVAKLIFDERWEGAEAVSCSLLLHFQAFRGRL